MLNAGLRWKAGIHRCSASPLQKLRLQYLTPLPPPLNLRYLSSRYDAVVKQVPLMAVHSAARGQVDPDVYTAPPLRMEAQGWHPEWGKVSRAALNSCCV